LPQWQELDALRRLHVVVDHPPTDTSAVQHDTDPGAHGDLVRPTLGDGVVEELGECRHVGAHPYEALG
jgi:hypothetical protein